MKQLKFSIFFLLLISGCNNQSLKDKYSIRNNKFKQLDFKLNNLAKQLGANVISKPGGATIDGVSVPQSKLQIREIVWIDGSIGKAIIIDQNFENMKIDSPDWNLINIAWLQDRGLTTRGRPFWSKYLLKKVDFIKIESNIDQLLKESLDNLRAVKKSDLGYD